MYKYGQYCPVARAAEILGDRWTLLIVRDLLNGLQHFNDLERGLPGISRGILAERLRRLEKMDVIEKHTDAGGRHTTKYSLTAQGQELQTVIDALMMWGAKWAFGKPEEEELDPVLLLWWMRNRVNVDRLPAKRVVIQFDFSGLSAGRYWLVLAEEDLSLCLKFPGYEIDVFIKAELDVFYEMWLGRISYAKALAEDLVTVEATPAFERAFPTWFAFSPAAATVRAATDMTS